MSSSESGIQTTNPFYKQGGGSDLDDFMTPHAEKHAFNSSIMDVKLGNKGEVYYRETIFDEFGRKIGHNDYTNHGRSDILSHTNPHYHSNPVNNLSQHGSGIPELHPQTPR